jgi:chromosome condensin MukBEF MukE localization factor
VSSTWGRELGLPSCPITVDTIGKMMEYQLDNEMFLHDFDKMLEMICRYYIAFIIYVCVSFTCLLMGCMVSFVIAKSYV